MKPMPEPGKERRYLCRRYVGSVELAPAIVAIDPGKPGDEPRAEAFDGLEPHSTVYYNGTIRWTPGQGVVFEP